MKHLPALLLAKKRDGAELSDEEVHDLVSGVVDGSLTDAQLGALLMAGLLRGGTAAETANWTRAMRDSGFVHDLSSVPGAKVDKHSTGGVGDKVSLVLAPLAAVCGVRVPMISGRGLGHTGGTVDKLESIPGFRMDLSRDEFVAAIERRGVAMAAATAEIAPADRRMYSVRDVTGTVESVSWITASILSKKLAEGIDALVLDVKCGRGAFMKDLARARELAETIVATAELCGCKTRARLTQMDTPLGVAIGNALEVVESVECLRGDGPPDLRELVLLLAADMLVLGGVVDEHGAASEIAAAALDDGRALACFAEVVEAQGGDPRVTDDPWVVLARAPFVVDVLADRSGWVRDVDPYGLAIVALCLGAGRQRSGEAIDPSVGLEAVGRVGDEVSTGDVVARVHARTAADAERAREGTAACVVIGAERPESRPLLLGSVGFDVPSP